MLILSPIRFGHDLGAEEDVVVLFWPPASAVEFGSMFSAVESAFALLWELVDSWGALFLLFLNIAI